jgi:hypothetical protein
MWASILDLMVTEATAVREGIDCRRAAGIEARVLLRL